MGLFDSVYADCPDCGTKIEFQSKAGRCELASYQIEAVPMDIAMDLEGAHSSCENCGKTVTLRNHFRIDSVPMWLEK